MFHLFIFLNVDITCFPYNVVSKQLILISGTSMDSCMQILILPDTSVWLPISICFDILAVFAVLHIQGVNSCHENSGIGLHPGCGHVNRIQI